MSKTINVLKEVSDPIRVAPDIIFDLTEVLRAPARYISWEFIPEEVEHSLVANLLLFERHDRKEPTMTIRFGMLPYVKSWILLDKEWLNGETLFPDAPKGVLKFVCHGSRIERQAIVKAQLVLSSGGSNFSGRIENLLLHEVKPTQPPLEAARLADIFGQNTKKEWPEKITDPTQLKMSLSFEESEVSWPQTSWSCYGGDEEEKLAAGTGFFTSYKRDNRWYLVDPEGNAFFSNGPDCVNVNSDCKISGIENWCEWLPTAEEPGFNEFYTAGKTPEGTPIMSYSFLKANLYRVYGEQWEEKWQELILDQLQSLGMNTIGNWSDPSLFDKKRLPYVASLPEFPDTQQMIFRDFPDVFSEEYAVNAARCAEALFERRDDPWMIGYFLRNEPAWAFVDGLNLADEVLFNPAATASKEMLIKNLKTQYGGAISELNVAWQTDFSDFDELKQPQQSLSQKSPQAAADLRAFSVEMVRRYVTIPAQACRRVDPNHMILGMRWAWISDGDLIAGWENFDVFSINCYAVDPTTQIQQVVDLGVDLPVLIGEFHFGALDAGLSATGLEGVENQEQRGAAYRQYVEKTAAHPNGVGCHYFQCYDQFHLGRFDGENYNIGIFDICGQPYVAMAVAIHEVSKSLYSVNAGRKAPFEKKIATIPMIAY